MPRKYDKDTKMDAMVQLSMYTKINTVHQLTGIPQRTLRRWRKQLQQKQNYMSEKNVSADTTRSQNNENGHNAVTNPEKRSQHGHKTSISGHNAVTKTDDDGHKTENGHKTDTIDPEEGMLVGLPRKSLAGREGVSYPYPIADDEEYNSDHYEDFKRLRAKLMTHAQTLADDLVTADDNINLRSLAFARILDRIMQLDAIIPTFNPEKVMRIEYLYDGSVHKTPPWAQPALPPDSTDEGEVPDA